LTTITRSGAVSNKCISPIYRHNSLKINHVTRFVTHWHC